VLRVIVAYLRDVAERRGVLAAYEQWHGKVVEKKTMAAKAMKVVYRWVHRCVRQAMDAWHGSTVKEVRRRIVFIRIVQRMQKRCVVVAFEMWLGVLALKERMARARTEQAEARSLRIMQKILFRWSNMLVFTAFDRWASSIQRREQIGFIFGALSKEMLNAGKEIEIFSVIADALQIQLSHVMGEAALLSYYPFGPCA
jgi:hypothetical protein